MSRAYRIAIVEGDDLIREIVQRWLSEAGHTVEVRSLSALLAGNGFDVILVDVASPRSGAPLIAAIRAVHQAPIVMLSARLRSNQAGSSSLARQLGVKAVLGKPFSREELLAAIESV
ncbi:MAG: response regulator [Caldimonas sp.]